MLKICRVCLATDVELQSLGEPLSSTHNKLCDYYNYDMKLCCPKCIYLLRKFHNFKNKCKRACAILKKWEKQSKNTRLPLNNLQTLLPNSLGFSNENNRPIYSYISQIENDDDNYLQDIHSLLSTDVDSYVILDVTDTPFDDIEVTQKDKVDDELESIVKIEEFDDCVKNLVDIDHDYVIPKEDKESKPKKIKFWPGSKEDLEETQILVKTKFGDGEVKDIKGNVIDVDSILNNLDKMHNLTYNKVKRYCADNDPLSKQALEFFASLQRRYGNQYSSIFITKHLTTDEEIIEELRRRENDENYVRSQYKCTKCFRYFKYAKQLDYHIATFHDPNKIHRCQYCDVGYNSVKRLRNHLNYHRMVYQCKLCPLVTNYPSIVETHSNRHKGVRYPCLKCGADSKSPANLAAHMMNHHQSDHICPYCGRNFNSKYGLHLHKRMKHPNDVDIVGPPSAKCEQCNIQFLNDEVYRYHVRKSHSEVKSDPKNIVSDVYKKRKPCANRRAPKYTCRECGGVESSMGALIWHFKTEHPHETFDRKGIALRAPYQYLCHECGKGFKDITSYTDHKNIHTGVSPYKCPECPKAFHSRNHLRNHIKFHLPPTKECEQCGKKFHSTANLSNHLRQHTGNRRYACKLCGKTFLHQASVNEHVKGVHLKIRRNRVIDGFEALDDLEKMAVNPKVLKPVTDAKITSVTIHANPLVG